MAVYTYDEIVLVCEILMRNKWRSLSPTDPDVVALSKLLRAAPIHPEADKDAKFRNEAGIARKSADIATRHDDYTGKPTKGNRLDVIVLKAFLDDPAGMVRHAALVRSAIELGELKHPDLERVEEDEEPSATEGGVLAALQTRRERSPALRAKKIASAKRKGTPIACEICAFDFFTTYGVRGEDYVEVHHRTPLHVTGRVTTKLADLIMLCANCHRMVHRRQPWLTIDELAVLLAK